MAWHYELRGPVDNLVFFGGGHATRAEAEKAAQAALNAWFSRGLELHIRIGATGPVGGEAGDENPTAPLPVLRLRRGIARGSAL